MNTLAALSALALLGALSWSATHPQTIRYSAPRAAAIERGRADAQTDALAIALQASSTPLGDAVLSQFAARYQELASQGDVSSSTAASAADIMPEVSYKTYSTADVATDPDVSLQRVIRYRSDLRLALMPLLNSTTPEFEIYARYVDTRNETHLDRLKAVASDYRVEIAQTLKVKAPRDASARHLAILDAMSRFAATLDALADNAKDPIASVALLRAYNEAERSMFTSFDALGRYAAAKAL